MKRTAIFAAALFAAASLNGQTVTTTTDFSSFNTIDVSYDFDVTLHYGKTPRVDKTVDEALKDLVEVYVKSKVLHISFNKRGMTGAIKKLYKGKDAAAPVLKVDVYVPSIETIKLTDYATLDASGQTFFLDDFTLVAEGRSKVTNLAVNVKNSARVEVGSDAVVTAKITSNNGVDVNVQKNGVLYMDHESKTLNITSDGSSTVNLSGNATSVNVTNSGRSKLNFVAGSCENLNVCSKGSSAINASGFNALDASLVMTGGQIVVKAENILKMNISDKALVAFLGDPEIEIIEISGASVKPYSEKEK